MLLQVEPFKLTHEDLITFMADVSDIVNVLGTNNLIPVSTDPEAPLILTPAMLLTQKPALHLLQSMKNMFLQHLLVRTVHR